MWRRRPPRPPPFTTTNHRYHPHHGSLSSVLWNATTTAPRSVCCYCRTDHRPPSALPQGRRSWSCLIRPSPPQLDACWVTATMPWSNRGQSCVFFGRECGMAQHCSGAVCSPANGRHYVRAGGVSNRNDSLTKRHRTTDNCSATYFNHRNLQSATIAIAATTIRAMMAPSMCSQSSRSFGSSLDSDSIRNSNGSSNGTPDTTNSKGNNPRSPLRHQHPRLCSGCGVAMVPTERSSDGVAAGAAAGLGDTDNPPIQPRNQATTTTTKIHNPNKNQTSDISDTHHNQYHHQQQQRRAQYYDVGSQGYGRRHGIPPVVCDRCQALRRENLYDAYDALQDVSPDVFASQITSIVRHVHHRAIIVLVVDATDPEHSSVPQLRRLVGGRTKTTPPVPCHLVLTKLDLLPRLTSGDVRTLHRLVRNRTGVTFAQAHAVSAVTGHGLVGLAEQLLHSLGGRNVICVGSANAGKSTLVQRLAPLLWLGAAEPRVAADKRKEPARRTSVAADAQRRHTQIQQVSSQITASHLPGTTLQAVRIPCFASPHHALWDTPGVLSKKALAYRLFPTHCMEPLARPAAIRVPEGNEGDADLTVLCGNVRAGQSILIEAAWMDSEEGDQDKTIEPCVLGRIDVDDVCGYGMPERIMATTNDDDKSSTTMANPPVATLYAQAYIHPSLRVRVVPTPDAPTAATIPPSYIAKVQGLLSKNRTAVNTAFLETDNNKPYSKALAPHVFDPKAPRGEIRPGRKEQTPNGRYQMDIVFASLGWIAISHDRSFTLIPHCVEGSVFSRRRSLYPRNVNQHLGDTPDTAFPIDLDAPSIQKRLYEAAQAGRHSSNRRKSSNTAYIANEFAAGAYDDPLEEEWYS